MVLDRDTTKRMFTHMINMMEQHDTMTISCGDPLMELLKDVRELLKEQGAKQYNNHEVACIIADLFGDPCACNFNNIDEWLPYKCDFRETCCPNPVGVACWEQYLKHKEGR